jgi:aspartyl-tRNA(Asn)/glutamyl-tRNA(Gln) amidotransferase subunit A
MVRKVRDLAYALDVCIGPDPYDPFSLPRSHGPWTDAVNDLGPPSKVAWAPTLGAEVDGEIAEVCEAAVRRLESEGTEVIAVDSVFRSDPIFDWFVMWTAYREEGQGHLRGTPDWELITPALRDQMDYAHTSVGTVELTRAINSIYAHNADLVALFDRAPLLLCPTVAGQTARVGHEGTVNGVETAFWVAFTPPFNLTRSPAGSVCAGYTGDGMPVGLQVVGPQHADVAVLRTMAVLEDLLDLDPLAPID